jgi:hypothetical protein
VRTAYAMIDEIERGEKFRSVVGIMNHRLKKAC